MRKSFFLIVLTLVGQPGRGVAQQQPDQPRPASQIIPIYSSNQHGLVIVHFNNGPSVPLLFDTGTTDNILDSAYAGRLGLAHLGPSRITDGATGKPVPGYSSFVRLVAARNFTREQVPVQVTDFSHPEAVGVLGPNLFSGSLVQLEFARDRLIISNKSPGSIPQSAAESYLGPQGDALPAAHISIAGLTVKAVLDSGNSEAVTLPLSMSKKIPLASAPALSGVARSASGNQNLYRARLEGDLKVGPLTLRNPDINFVEHDADPNIGLPILQRLKIVLDPAEHRDWVIFVKESGLNCENVSSEH